MKKERSAKQLANDQRLRDQAAQKTAPVEQLPDASREAMQRQIDEIMETNLLLKAALLNGTVRTNQPTNTIGVSGGGRLLGEVEKYLVDPDNYPDPTPRLRKEPRLQPLAFDYNYELEYDVSVSNYETKSGVNTKEPRFRITMNQIRLNDQGEQTEGRVVRKVVMFHEDPQAALVIARENNIAVDKTDEKTFLDEMRYLRVRDWLFSLFWGEKVAPESSVLHEEVIGGQLMQVFTRSSRDSTGVDFDQINGKMRT